MEVAKVRQRLQNKATSVLQDSDLSEMLELMGAEENDAAASAAMKAIMAERMSAYAFAAMKEARKHRMKMGAAAIIIAANE